MSRVLPMKRTVAPAEGERTKEMEVWGERGCGVSSMWVVGVVWMMGEEGIEAV